MSECRFCGDKKLDKILDLGMHPLSNSFLSKKDEVETKYPLELMNCPTCGLVQLSYIVEPSLIFNKDYVYHTGTAKPIIDHAKWLVKDYTEWQGRGRFVVEVGSNDGNILKYFQDHHSVLGIEPCENVANEAINNRVPTKIEFFNKKAAVEVRQEFGRADLILLRNVFAHIPNIHEVMIALTELLQPDGIIEIEAPWLLNIIKNIEFDTIYHEHYSYLSLKAIKYLMNLYDLEVFAINELDIHGGSLLYYIGRKGKFPIKESVCRIERLERILNTQAYEYLRGQTERIKLDLISLFSKLNFEKATVVGLGAPAKGNTLLNYCNINNEHINYCTDTTLAKQNKFTPGSHIPVFSEEKLNNGHKIDYLLILAWNFLDYILTKPEIIKLRDNGTKLIVPIPNVRVI